MRTQNCFRLLTLGSFYNNTEQNDISRYPSDHFAKVQFQDAVRRQWEIFMYLALLCSPICCCSCSTMLHLRKKVVEDSGKEARGDSQLCGGGESTEHSVGLSRACLAIGKDADVEPFETVFDCSSSQGCSRALESFVHMHDWAIHRRHSSFHNRQAFGADLVLEAANDHHKQILQFRPRQAMNKEWRHAKRGAVEAYPQTVDPGWWRHRKPCPHGTD